MQNIETHTLQISTSERDNDLNRQLVQDLFRDKLNSVLENKFLTESRTAVMLATGDKHLSPEEQNSYLYVLNSFGAAAVDDGVKILELNNYDLTEPSLQSYTSKVTDTQKMGAIFGGFIVRTKNSLEMLVEQNPKNENIAHQLMHYSIAEKAYAVVHGPLHVRLSRAYRDDNTNTSQTLIAA